MEMISLEGEEKAKSENRGEAAIRTTPK